MKKICFTLLLPVAFAMSACSMKNAEERLLQFGIKLDKQSASHNASSLSNPASLLDSVAPGFVSSQDDLNILADPVPVDINSFNCFAVNVTGPGIPSANKISNDPSDVCTFSGRMSQTGVGYLSEAVDAGKPIQLMVTTGSGRKVDVYGLFPSSTPCEHSNPTYGGGGGGGFPVIEDREPVSGGWGFFVGSKIVDVIDNTSISIPVGLSPGTPPSVHCSGGGDRIMLNLKAKSRSAPFQNIGCNNLDIQAAACAYGSSDLSPSVLESLSDNNDSNAGVALATASYYLYLQFDIENIDLSIYRYFKLESWLRPNSGQALGGHYYANGYNTLGSISPAPLANNWGYASTAWIDLSSATNFFIVNGRKKLVVRINNAGLTLDVDAIFGTLSKNNN